MPGQMIGFIGLGVMGSAMAGHLLEAGHELHVHNRTRGRADDLVEAGAQWHDDPASLAAVSEVVITIVGFPADVEEVWFGDSGLLGSVRPDALLIDMTTSSPLLAKRIDEAARRADAHALDAPVSGGDRGAREATLSIMVGGEREDFDRARPLFEAMGTNIQLQGPAGSGQHTKMCNQIAIAAGMLGVCEAMLYAKAAGLDPFHVLDSIETGAAGSWSLSNLMPRALSDDFAPGFKIRHFVKDLGIALDSASELDLRLPGLELAAELYRRLEDAGEGDSGTQALLGLYEQGGV